VNPETVAVAGLTGTHLMNEWPTTAADRSRTREALSADVLDEVWKVERVLAAARDAVAARAAQQVAAGDWVLAVPASMSVEKVDPPPFGENQVDARPGRPVRYTCRVTSVDRAPGRGTEAIRVDAPGVGVIVRNIPGAADAPILFPCCEPGCAVPAYVSPNGTSGHAWCTRHPSRSGAADRLARLTARTDALAYLLGGEFEFPELRAAARAACSVTSELVARCRAEVRSEEAVRRHDAARRQQAQTTEADERATMLRLMAKFGVQAAAPPAAPAAAAPITGGIPAVGQRLLEL
jgi:hypothetical protein